jgi:hypothetical protein
MIRIEQNIEIKIILHDHMIVIQRKRRQMGQKRLNFTKVESARDINGTP